MIASLVVAAASGFILPRYAPATETIGIGIFNGSNGTYPQGGVCVDANQNVFGVTPQGGLYGDGTIFEIPAGTYKATAVYNFNGSDGSLGYGQLATDSAGNFYGTTYSGGASGNGTLFEFNAASHSLNTICSFNVSNGARPTGKVIFDSSGNMYGTTQTGGVNGAGTVFEVPAGTHNLTTIASLGYSYGTDPIAGVTMDPQGNLYGTTFSGTIFEVSAGSHTLSAVATVPGVNVTGPCIFAGVTLDSQGNMFGVTGQGGKYLGGTLFEIAASNHAVSTLASFPQSNTDEPDSTLIEDAAGNFYGATIGDGNGGVLFKYESSNSFLIPIGNLPMGGGQGDIAVDLQGNLYETDPQKSLNDVGCVYEAVYTGFVLPVPEPSSVSLLTVCVVGLLHRRRRYSAIARFPMP